MKRPIRRATRTLLVESLETRALMAGNDLGLWPLANVETGTSIFVRFRPTATPGQEQEALQGLRASVVTEYPDGPELVRLGEGVSPYGAIAGLSTNPAVLYASPDSTIHSATVPVYPNDPAFGSDAGLANPNGVNIDAPLAWGVTTGNPTTIVAVLDTGIDLNNPDLASKVWTNPVNDAASGYVNDVHGWNFVANDNNVQDDNIEGTGVNRQYVGHGTHVSGIIAAAANNNYGIAGVDWAAVIMPLKTLDSQGNGSTDLAVSAIYYAVAHGAKVINASWGGVNYSAAMGDAIAYANAHNVVFVTASGNDGTNNDQTPSYPASFRQPNELSVAAVDQSGNLPSFSNYGPTTVDIAAPGVGIVSDALLAANTGGLESLTGTSMSTAYVSGVAALVSGQYPQLTAAQIVSRIDATAKPLPGLAGKVISGGIVDAYNALTAGGISASGLTPAAGLPALTALHATDAQVQGSLLASDEFLAVHGGTDQGFVTGVYQQVLGRSPDAAGLAQWTAAYDSGTYTRYQLAEAILASPEAKLTEVARWFQQDLGRTASLDSLKADPGVAAWANLLEQGVGDDSVHAAIVGSFEYLVDHGANPNSVVQGFFENLDDRAPSTAEDSAWAGLLWSGFAPFTVLRYFQGTPEVQDTKVARWFAEDLGRTGSIAAIKADPGVQAWAADLGNF